MSEEKKDEVVVVEDPVKEEPKKVAEVVEEPEYTEVEQAAMHEGWLPKDKWEESGKDPNDWRSAKEFQERGELFKTIHQTKRELKQTQSTLDSLKRHHQFVYDQAYRKAKADLKKERRAAMLSDDLDRVEQVEEEIEKLDDEYDKGRTQLTQETQAADPTPNVEFDTWRSRNSWYDRDPDLREQADVIGLVYNRKNPSAQPIEVLRYVEDKIKKQFPDKFGIRKAAPNAVASVDRTQSSRKKAEPEFQLSEMEEAICQDLVREGVLTREQYIKELKGAK